MSTSDRLIESTRELLWERGYVGTSPKAILERAGAGQGSMYHHFKGKPDLALAAIRRTAEDLRATAEGVLGGPGTPYERIKAYLRRERDVLRGCPIGRLTMDPDVIASDELRAPVDETIDWIRERRHPTGSLPDLRALSGDLHVGRLPYGDGGVSSESRPRTPVSNAAGEPDARART